MKISLPFLISSRLLPAVRIGDATVQLEFSTRPGRDGRNRYRWTIDLDAGGTYSDDDLQSGCGGGTIADGFASLLSFLSACGESYRYREATGRGGDNADLFPEPVAQWAAENEDEISMLAMELEENPEAYFEGYCSEAAE